MTTRTINVGIDGSASAMGAFAFAAGFGRATNASVVAIHCWQTPSPCIYPGAAWTPDDAVDHGCRLLSTAVESAGGTCAAETQVRRGKPGTVLFTESRDADLLVIGTTGIATTSAAESSAPPGPDTRTFLGSTARYLVDRAAGPVAAVPLGATWVDDPTVVVGVDGSATSVEALRWAVRSLPDSATIRAVQSVTMPTDGDVPVDYELLDPVVEQHRAELEALVADALADLGPLRTSPSSHIVLGADRDALLQPGFAVDLIVMGRHGTTAASAKAIGSVSEHTLKHATVPVIIVPPASPTRTT